MKPKKNFRTRNQNKALPNGKKAFKISGLRRFFLALPFSAAGKAAALKGSAI
ncbi:MULTISPECIES: hypothetical protein [Roseicella]|uniref:Uncharacterized protein n=1 Tax=Roseicella aerolata TaxID=2883479 RepID=A0A9X1LCI1_9PROT|nr:MULTISPECIES: hypothetical protein [Roseicella]MCB4824215.1 hypothetical protein [Roseicella aerolata]